MIKRIVLGVIMLTGILAATESAFFVVQTGIRYWQERQNQGDLFSARTIRILALGESTTAMTFSSQGTWPWELERVLRDRFPTRRIYVINKGVMGATSGDIVARMPEYLATYRPQIIVTMMGINDANTYYPTAPENPFIPVVKRAEDPWYSRLAILRLWRWGIARLRPEPSPPEVAGTVDETTFNQTVEELQRAIRDDPGNGKNLVDLAIVYEHAGMYGEAELTLLRAKELSGTQHWALVELGKLKRKQMRFPEAEQAFRAAMRLEPDHPLAYRELEYLYRQMGRVHEVDAMERQSLTRTQLGKNYLALEDMASRSGALLVAVSYPMRSVATLRHLVGSDVPVVDMDTPFRARLAAESYDALFTDRFAGDFGHLTPHGNGILAAQVAEAVGPMLDRFFPY